MLRHFDKELSPDVQRLQRVLNALMFFSSEHQIDLWEHSAIGELKNIPANHANANIAHLLKARTGIALSEDHIFRFLQGVDTVCWISDTLAKRCDLSTLRGVSVTYFKTRELVAADSPIAIPGLDPAEVGFGGDAFQAIAEFPYLDEWKNCCLGRFNLHNIDCDHLSLFEPKHIGEVAASIAGILRRV